MTSGEGPSHEANAFISSSRGIGSPGNTAAVDETLMGSDAGNSDLLPGIDFLHGSAKMRLVRYRKRLRQGRVGDRARPIKGPPIHHHHHHPIKRYSETVETGYSTF